MVKSCCSEPNDMQSTVQRQTGVRNTTYLNTLEVSQLKMNDYGRGEVNWLESDVKHSTREGNSRASYGNGGASLAVGVPVKEKKCDVAKDILVDAEVSPCDCRMSSSGIVNFVKKCNHELKVKGTKVNSSHSLSNDASHTRSNANKENDESTQISQCSSSHTSLVQQTKHARGRPILLQSPSVHDTAVVELVKLCKHVSFTNDTGKVDEACELEAESPNQSHTLETQAYTHTKQTQTSRSSMMNSESVQEAPLSTVQSQQSINPPSPRRPLVTSIPTQVARTHVIHNTNSDTRDAITCTKDTSNGMFMLPVASVLSLSSPSSTHMFTSVELQNKCPSSALSPTATLTKPSLHHKRKAGDDQIDIAHVRQEDVQSFDFSEVGRMLTENGLLSTCLNSINNESDLREIKSPETGKERSSSLDQVSDLILALEEVDQESAKKDRIARETTAKCGRSLTSDGGFVVGTDQQNEDDADGFIEEMSFLVKRLKVDTQAHMSYVS
eukprot:CFRG2808T1